MKLDERVTILEKCLEEAEQTVARHTVTIEALEARITALEEPKQRGPKTDRPMTEVDAYRVKFGDLKPPMSHKDAAEKLGLSYGQVFSCRGGYTFKHVKTGTRNDDGSEIAKPADGGAK